MTGVVLQARLSSSRLPDKVLLPLGQLTAIEHAMRALRELPVATWVLATDAASCARLAPYAHKQGFALFAGDPEDVLHRYAAVVRRYRLDTVVRATGDNPLVSPQLARISLQAHFNSAAEYTGLLGPPLGTCVEVLDAAALLAAEREADSPYDREHVAPYLYANPDRFRVLRPQVAARFSMPQARVTLDSIEDYERLQELYTDLYDGRPLEIAQVLAWLRQQLIACVPESHRT